MIDTTDSLGILADMQQSGGSPRDFTDPQVSALRELYADRDTGLWFFSQHIFGFKDLKFEIHAPICQFIGHWGETYLTDGTVTDRPFDVQDPRCVKSYRRLMVRVSREFFKTSLLTRANSLWTLMTKDIDATIGIFNEKEANPVSWIDAIRNVVESSILLQVLYRDFMPQGVGFWDREKGISKLRTQKWGGTGMLFNRNSHGVSELSIEPQGIGGAQAGKHYTHKILDDIIGLAAKESPAVMENAIEWVDHSRPLERPAEGGCELVCHTRWSYADVYTHMEEKWPGEYLILQRSLLENPETGVADDVNGVSIFPEKISTRKAYAMKKADPFTFSAQYQNIPKAGKDQSFAEEWLGRCHVIQLGDRLGLQYDITGGYEKFNPEVVDKECLERGEKGPQTVPLELCDVGIILDPAPSAESDIRSNSKARNGLVAVAMDPWGRCTCLHGWFSKETSTSILKELAKESEMWQCYKVGIEEVTFSSLYAPLWSRIIELDPQYKDFKPEFRKMLTKSRDKHKRIRDNLLWPMENGLWYFNAGVPMNMQPDNQQGRFPPGGPCSYLIAEILAFPYGGTVDIVDALSYTPEFLSRSDTPTELQNSFYRKKAEEDRGCTGYGFS